MTHSLNPIGYACDSAMRPRRVHSYLLGRPDCHPRITLNIATWTRPIQHYIYCKVMGNVTHCLNVSLFCNVTPMLFKRRATGLLVLSPC